MPMTTTYLGHKIEIEPFEWGYLAHIREPGSNARFVAASSSAFKALDDACNAIDAARRAHEQDDRDDATGNDRPESDQVEAALPPRPTASVAATGHYQES